MTVNFSIMLTVLAIAAQSVSGQVAPVASTEQNVDESVADGGVRFSLDVDSPFGLYTFVPGQWGELHVRLENGGDAARDLLCTSYFAGQPTLQFGRHVWVPPRSRLSLSHPVRLPAADEFEGNRALVHSLVIEGSSENEVLIKSDSGQLRYDRSFLVAPSDRHSAIVAGWNSDGAVPQDVFDLLIASRINQGLNEKVTVLGGHFLPADETSLSYLDHIIIAEQRLADDLAALSAVRRWLHAGGRLWIMLDRTDPIILERLFGDEFRGYVVDRVGLTSVRIDVAASHLVPDAGPREPVHYENPVELARLVASGMEVRNTVNGWPAALSMDYGQGRVLITTLGPRGWMKSAASFNDGTSEVPPAEPSSEFTVLSPMEELAAYLLAKREPVPIRQSDLESIAQEYVAYEVPTFGLIAGAMGLFLALLAAIGVWLWNRKRLEYFGWSGSLLAVLFGMLLIGRGLTNRYRVPATMASEQLAQAISGTDDVRTYGVTAVYRPEGSESPIRTSQGGELWPDMTGIGGSTRRMVTTDLDTYHWEGLPQPAGLRIYPHVSSRSFSDRIAARATINDRGVVGQFSGLASAGENAILATRQGRVDVTIEGGGQFRADADDVLEADQYMDAAFLGDVEDRRRRILQVLFENRNWTNTLERPLFMTWVNDWDQGFDFGEGLNREGDTLLAVPLEISRPPAGTEMVIPSPLISFRSCPPPDGSTSSGFWDDTSREWQERSRPSTTWLSFQVPRGLLPSKGTKARLDVDVSGLMGRLEILGVRNGEVVSLQSVTGPVGSLSFEIDDPDVLTVSDQGDLTLGIRAGVPAQAGGDDSRSAQASAGTNLATPVNYWRIESLSMQLWAQSEGLTE